MPTKFSKAFKNQAIEKCLNAANESSIKQIAEELNIGYSTLQRWVRNAHKAEDPRNVPSNSSGNIWSLAEKLAIVSKAMQLSEPELGALCREQGIYIHQISD